MRSYVIGGACVLLVGIVAVFLLGGDMRAESVNGLTPAKAFTHAHGLAIDNGDPSKLYIATHEGLYLLQNDKELYRVGDVRDDLMGFSIDGSTPGTFYSSGHFRGGGNIGLQKTTDGGLSWQRVSLGLEGPVDFHAMTVSAADPTVVYGYYGGKLQRSKDGGESWERAVGSVMPIALVSHPTRASVLYAATPKGVQVTEDYGNTWRSLSVQLDTGAVLALAIDSVDTDRLLAFSEALNGLGKSTDGGRSWRSISESFGGSDVLHLAMSSSDPNTVYALTSANAVYKSSDGGDAWARIR